MVRGIGEAQWGKGGPEEKGEKEVEIKNIVHTFFRYNIFEYCFL